MDWFLAVTIKTTTYPGHKQLGHRQLSFLVRVGRGPAYRGHHFSATPTEGLAVFVALHCGRPERCGTHVVGLVCGALQSFLCLVLYAVLRLFVCLLRVSYASPSPASRLDSIQQSADQPVKV